MVGGSTGCSFSAQDVPPGVPVVVAGNVKIESNVTFTGDLVVPPGSSVVFGGDAKVEGNVNITGKVVFEDGVAVNVAGNLTLGEDSVLQTTQSADGSSSGPLIVAGTMSFGGSLVTSLVYSPYTPSKRRRMGMGMGREVVAASTTSGAATTSAGSGSTTAVNLEIPIAQFQTSQGTFQNVSVQLGSGYNGASCDLVQPNPIIEYGATTLSTVVTVLRRTDVPGCGLESGGLSTGAIVGIVMGVVAFVAIGFALLLIFLRRRELEARTTMFKQSMKSRIKSNA